MPAWILVILQSFVLVVTVLIISKIIGKRNITQITPFYLIVLIAIGVISAALSMNLLPNQIHGVLALGVWVLIPVALTFLSIRSKWVYDLLEGKEKVVIKHGKIMEENLQKERYTPEDLLRQLRSKNVFSVADVEFAVLEPTGEINPLLKSDKQPVTAKDLGEKVATQVEPQTIILDGKIMDEPLSTLGLSRQWLEIEIDKMGISPENVFVCQVNSFGEIYVDLFNDALQLPKPKVRELLYANLSKAVADLYTFSMDTQDKNAKKTYYQDAEKLEELLVKLRPMLLH